MTVSKEFDTSAIINASFPDGNRQDKYAAPTPEVEPADYQIRMVEGGNYGRWQTTSKDMHDKLSNVKGWEGRKLYTHPAPTPEVELSALRVMVHELLPLLYGGMPISKIYLDGLRELAFAPASDELVNVAKAVVEYFRTVEIPPSVTAFVRLQNLSAALDKVKS